MADKPALNAYETIGVAIPGAVVVLVASAALPEFREFFGKDAPSVGGFGIFVAMSYIAGQIIQSLGNRLEQGVWTVLGGMPTDWVRSKKKTKLLSTQQLSRLDTLIKHRYPNFESAEKLSRREWYAITREIYASLEKDGRVDRIESFNRNYGMLRGLAVAFLFSIAVFVVLHPGDWKIPVGLACASMMAIDRMVRFGTHYARELFVQFLAIDKT
jgi:hypothetical protein